MQEASEAVPSGMMTVILRADAKLKYALHTARLYCLKKIGIEEPVCSTAVHLYPEVKVIAGHIEVSIAAVWNQTIYIYYKIGFTLICQLVKRFLQKQYSNKSLYTK